MTGSTHSRIKTQIRKVDGLAIRYAESEPRDVSAILLSPWPESLFTFEQMWPRLAEHAHLVAIDLPGFGHSERRNDLLTPSTMGEFVAQVVEEFGLIRPHAVGPDIGTSALLFTAAKYPGLFRSLVVGNGTAAVPIQVGSVLKDVVEAPSLEPFRKLDPRQGVESVLAFVERYELPDYVREDFFSSYEGDRFAESLRFVRSYPTELPVLSKLLPTIETPVQIITGDHDPGVLPVNGDYLHDRLPHNKHDKVDAGHFAWADAADEYAALVIDWWNGGYDDSRSKKITQ
jgi:pimeloyl-ACP methyl ester carboxylesterase